MLPQDSRAEIKTGLWKELQSEGFKEYFDGLKTQIPELGQFSLPEDLIRFMHGRGKGQHQVKDRILYQLIKLYRLSPPEQPRLLTLLLVILWRRMEMSFNAFASVLRRLNPCDPFSEVYWWYIDVILNGYFKSAKRMVLRLKDKAEYLIWRELKKEIWDIEEILPDSSDFVSDSDQNSPVVYRGIKPRKGVR